MFGRYFHSLTSHASIQYRTIPLRPLNAERQERMFKQAKMITKSTSNQQPNQIIRNVVQWVHEESKLESCDQLAKEESEILKLAHTLPAKKKHILFLAVDSKDSHSLPSTP